MTVRGARWLALLLAMGCGSAAPTKTASNARDVEPTQPGHSEEAVCAPGAQWDGSACVGKDGCPEGSEADAYGDCRVPLSEAERTALTAAIAEQDQIILGAQFQDVNALAERSRLQLLRDDPSGAQGQSDASNGLLDAQRAIAVDEKAAPGRVALALAIARSLLDPIAKAGAAARPMMLGLVEHLGRTAADGAGDTAAAAARTLIGFVLLDRGDAAGARAQFEEALRSSDRLEAAWIGLGDSHRAANEFDEAAAAYEKARAAAPESFDAKTALAAAKRKQPLRLAPGVEMPPGLPVLGIHGLAGAAPAPTPCSASAAKATADLCKAVAALVAAQSQSQTDAAVADILREYKALGCGSSCARHVGQALLDASHAFAGSARVAKAIATARLVLSEQAFAGLHPAAMLDTGDHYYRLGIFASAADWYERHADGTGDPASRAQSRERALLLRASLGDARSAADLAEDVVRHASAPVHTRAALVWLAAVLQPASDAQAMLRKHRQLLVDGGLGARVDDPSAPPTKGPLALARGVRLLAASRQWSPGAKP
jgi:tetratricopeptide (TPR) repeat protein